MNWSRAKQAMAEKLQAIEHARKSAEEARLSEARAAALEAARELEVARDQVVEAEGLWSDRLAAGRLDPVFQRALGSHLVERQGSAMAAQREVAETERLLELRRNAWRDLEMSVRTGEQVIRRGRRELDRRGSERNDREQSDQASWKWFNR